MVSVQHRVSDFSGHQHHLGTPSSRESWLYLEIVETVSLEWNWRIPISKYPGVPSSSRHWGEESPSFLLYLFLNTTGILLTGIVTVFASALDTHALRYSRFMLIHLCLIDTSRDLPDHSSSSSTPYPHRNFILLHSGHPSSAHCFS